MQSDDNRYDQFSRYVEEDKVRRKKIRAHSRRFIISVSVPGALAGVLAAGIIYLYPLGGTLNLFGHAVSRQTLQNTIRRPGPASERPGSAGERPGPAGEVVTGTEPAFEMETGPVAEPPETEIPFEAHHVDSTAPDNLIEYTELQYNGEPLSPDDFTPWYSMDFGYGEDYTGADGVITFRGNNFRDNPTYGTADMVSYQLKQVWSHPTGSLSYQNATWSGNGWTGQPLIVRWPDDIKQKMNLYDSAKAREGLVEVIYASMDGYVYFLDLETGEPTRDPLNLGWTFKGAGALDPRGYPVLYVGAGYDSSRGRARVFIVNLLDCSVMYTFGNEDDFSLRGSLSYFDSSPLLDAASDTLIYPGENGILYLIHLNTQYDPQAGTLSIHPDKILKWHYWGTRTSAESFWPGMEDSAAVYKGYLFVADNGGNLMCLNLNTMQLCWVQDILDDSNSTPVLSVEDGHLYLYVSTSFRLGWRSSTTATVPIWKIDAETGEIVWHTDYECYTQDGVSGGVQSTIAVGKNNLSDYIYVTVSMTASPYDGCLVCLNKKTGGIVWEHNSAYAWSSPVCVYNSAGEGKILYCDAGGRMYLLAGLSGEVYSTSTLSDGVIEASPAVYNSYVVVGTRACLIRGLKLE